MPILETYGPVKDNALATYDHVDVQIGTGYITYYGGIFLSGSSYLSGAKLRLSNNRFYSSCVSATTGLSGATTTPAKMLDLDFDVTFNLPQVVKGDVIVNLPIGFNDTNSTSIITEKGSVWVRKVTAGGTEMDLANASGGMFTSGSGITGTFTDMQAFLIPVPQTSFKKDETLRITTELWGNAEGTYTNAIRFFIGADPQGRLGTASDAAADIFRTGDVTTLSAQVPFRIDL